MLSFVPTDKTRFLKIKNNDWFPTIIDSLKCPTCQLTDIKKTKNRWVGSCSECGHIHNFLTPTPSQKVILALRQKILNLFGGTGSGKTTASSCVISEMMRNHAGANIIAFAQTQDQLKQTGKAELKKFFLDEEWVAFNEHRWVHRNGSAVNWYTADSEQKVRGANVSAAWLIESSGIKHEIFNQVQTRTRQDEVKLFLKDENGNVLMKWNEKENRYEAIVVKEYGIVINETNPTYEWPRDKALFLSHTVIYTENVRGIDKISQFVKPKADPENKNRFLDMVSIMFASVDNPMMTPEYIENIRMNYETKEEYERDIYCDMSFESGMIYGPYIKEMFVDSSVNWKEGRYSFGESMDPGGSGEGNDETAYGLFSIKHADSAYELPTIYIVDGYKKSGLTTFEESMEVANIRQRYNWEQSKNMYSSIDPSGIKKDKSTRNNIVTDLKKYGIFFSPDGVNVDINWGIKRVLDFLKAGKIKIVGGTKFAEEVMSELQSYVWSNKKGKSRGGSVPKPIDRNNHIMDMIRFFITKVPVNPLAIAKLYESELPGGKFSGMAKSKNRYNWDDNGDYDDNEFETGSGGIYTNDNYY